MYKGTDKNAAGQPGTALSGRPLFAFVHIEKAAGTSLIHVLRRAFFLRYFDVAPVYPGPHKFLKAKDLRALLRVYPWTRCIGGHSVVPFSDLDSAFPSLRYITLFREPCARYVSQYIFWRDKMGWDISFEQFLERKDAQNVQTKRIVGRSRAEQAKEVLAERFALVGTVEAFPKFLSALEQVTGREGLGSLVMRRNVSSKTDEAQELHERYRDRILENNYADLPVYEFVRTALAPRIDSESASSRPAEAHRNPSRDWRLLTDYAIRKIWLQPATAALRLSNGLGARGTYGQVRRDKN
jgi:hypothetical protein